MQIMLLQELFENHTPSVKAAGCVLRTTGEAASCIELQLVILENARQTGPDTVYKCITMTVTTRFIPFEYKLLD